jgi:hypothetical protein
MKTLEFEATLTNDFTLKVPAAVAEQIPKEGNVHVIVLLPDDEDADWRRLATEQFLAGYTEADAIYDSI